MLSKNIYFSQEKKVTRKIAEVFMSFEIEKNYEKNEMTDYECILLAGIPNAPSVYAPTKNPELSKQRQKQENEKI